MAATREDAPAVPEGWAWYSNVLRFTIRSLYAKITWDPLGADVDLHLRPPSGAGDSSASFAGDVAYYNRTPGWASLDHDCITTCTDEQISIEQSLGPGVYRFFAHYFSDHGKGPATVHAEVFNAGQKIVDKSFVLGATGAVQDIIVCNVTPQGQTQCPTTGEPLPALRAGHGEPMPPKPASGP